MHVGVGHIENSFFKDYLRRSRLRSSSILNPRNKWHADIEKN